MSFQDVGKMVEVRAAMALRAARTGLGWNQEKAASKAGMSKTTIARIETLAGTSAIANIHSLISLYEANGVSISNLHADPLCVTFGHDAVQDAFASLTDPERKRSDLGKARGPRKKTTPPDEAPQEQGGEPGPSSS